MARETTFDQLGKELLKIARTEYPAKTKVIMRNAGNKLRKKTIAKAKAETTPTPISKKKNSSKEKAFYLKSFKSTKAYKFPDGSDVVQVYNNSYHGHLIEYGHKQTDKAGNDHGYTPGKHILENAHKAYEGEFVEDVEKFIDDLLDEHGLA